MTQHGGTVHVVYDADFMENVVHLARQYFFKALFPMGRRRAFHFTATGQILIPAYSSAFP